MSGVVVVASRGTWMVGHELFVKNGFERVDQAPPHYELLVNRFNDSSLLPKFTGGWEKRLSKYSRGLTIIRSDQCPCIAKCAREISETAISLGLEVNTVELTNYREAQNTPSPYGVFNIVYNGKLIADHPISNKRFNNILIEILH
jgi:hypothetical protein